MRLKKYIADAEKLMSRQVIKGCARHLFRDNKMKKLFITALFAILMVGFATTANAQGENKTGAVNIGVSTNGKTQQQKAPNVVQKIDEGSQQTADYQKKIDFYRTKVNKFIKSVNNLQATEKNTLTPEKKEIEGLRDELNGLLKDMNGTQKDDFKAITGEFNDAVKTLQSKTAELEKVKKEKH